MDAALVRARAHVIAGESAAAFEAYRELIARDPDNLDAWDGAIHAVSDPESREWLREALDEVLATRDIPAASPLRVLHIELEDDLLRRESALRPFADSEDVVGGWAEAALAEVYLERGNAEAALLAYEKAVVKAPFLPRAWRGKAGVLVQLERYLDAIPAYEEYLGLRPNDSLALYNLGWILSRSAARHRDAIPYLTRALSQTPDDIDTLTALGSASLALDPPNVEEAEKSFARVRQLAPDDPETWWNLGVLEADFLDHPQVAVAHFERYLALGGAESERVRRWLKELRSGKKRRP